MLRNFDIFKSTYRNIPENFNLKRNATVRTLCTVVYNFTNAHLISNYTQPLTGRIYGTLLDGKSRVLGHNYSKEKRRWISNRLNFLVSFPFSDSPQVVRIFRLCLVKSDWHCWIAEAETSYIVLCDVNTSCGWRRTAWEKVTQIIAFRVTITLNLTFRWPCVVINSYNKTN